jgi:hypothetical protein
MLLRQPGGLSEADAVAGATAGLESLRAESGAALDAAMQRAEAAAAEGPPGSETLYRCASEIVEYAGGYGLGPMEKAAYSLCELVDALREAGRWNADGVAVHLQTLRLLRPAPPDSAEAYQPVLAGLEQVVVAARRPAAA